MDREPGNAAPVAVVCCPGASGLSVECLAAASSPALVCAHCTLSLVFAEICFVPVIVRIAIGNSEALIEKRQIEKGKVLPLQRAGGGTPQEQNAAIQEEKEHEAGKKQCTRRNIRSLE